jgi:DNA replication ATP-dependent helicase Dna2
VVEVREPRTVNTGGGEAELCEVVLRPERGAAEPVTVTLWRKWVETAEQLQPGMELLVVDPETEQFRGETRYTTGSDTFVIVEPTFVVDVTDVRSWVECPRIYYLNKLSGVPLNYPVLKGTLVHEVFGDLLRGRDLEPAIEDAVAEAALDLGLLGREPAEVAGDVRQHARAIEGWLSQGRLTDGGTGGSGFAPAGEWRSEQTLISETFGIKGRADAVRRGMPVELKTGKNTNREPRFKDKIQAACYALILGERASDGDGPLIGEGTPDTGTLLYTKNAAVDRTEESGDLSPAKEFSISTGLLAYVVRARNAIAATEYRGEVPTGYEGNARCEYCFEQDTCMVVAGRLGQESKAGTVGSPVPEEERAYFEGFYRALEAERRAVHREYAKLYEQSATERAKDDRALVDLEPLGRRQLADGRWELRAEPTGAVSKIREGDVVLASDGDPTRGDAELARVERLDEAVVVSTEEPIELRRLDVYPSELTVDRLLVALHEAVLKGGERRKDLLFGRREPAFREHDGTVFIDNNPAQDEAVRRAVTAEDCALVHGPPGTGKTYTLARTVRALVERGERVLLSAFTNRAVDNAVEALLEQGFEDVVRVGTESGVSEPIQPYRLADRGDPETLAAELQDAPVVAATTASCGSRAMRETSYDVAVVDEAGQLTEPGTLAAVNRADRFVLVGDHQQLPPVVQAEDADVDPDDRATEEWPLSRSLFERLIERYPDAGVLLNRQYRMAQRVQYFPDREFYDGQLRPASGEVAGQSLAELGIDVADLPRELRDAVTFVDPGGRAEGNTNPVEAERVAEIVRSYVDAGVDPADVGVIAPFRAQVAAITKRTPEGVAVDTVDRFQGSAREVIVVSFTATGDLSGPIFEDERRMNVALTRARRALCLVGDRAALESEPFYARMLAWAD